MLVLCIIEYMHTHTHTLRHDETIRGGIIETSKGKCFRNARFGRATAYLAYALGDL